MKKNIPNFFTSLVLLAGCISVVSASETEIVRGVYFIFLAAIFDFFDGFFARKLNAVSQFGKVYDSLADVVAFGFAPAFIFYKVMIMSLTNQDPTWNLETASLADKSLLYLAFLVTIFSGLRLARFTVDESTDKRYFRGLPTPANAILLASLALVLVETDREMFRSIILNIYFLIIIIALLSFLLVSNLKLLSLKFSNFKLAENISRYILIIITIIGLLIFGLPSIPFLFVLYVIISLMDAYLNRKSIT